MSKITENMKTVCKEKGVSFSKLEKELGFGNGSLAKSDKISAKRLYKIAQFLNVPMEYIITGEMPKEDEELAAIKRKNDLLKERNALLHKINKHYEAIVELRDKLKDTDKELAAHQEEKALTAKQWPEGQTISLSELRDKELHGVKDIGSKVTNV